MQLTLQRSCEVCAPSCTTHQSWHRALWSPESRDAQKRVAPAAGGGFTDHNAAWLKPSKRAAGQRAPLEHDEAEEDTEDEASLDEANGCLGGN